MKEENKTSNLLDIKCTKECTTTCKVSQEISFEMYESNEEVEPLNKTSINKNPSIVPKQSTIQDFAKETISPLDKSEMSRTKLVFARLPIFKLWLVFILTLGFTVILLVASHLTHSITLRVEAYHALYNLMALSGCLLTMKLWKRPSSIKNTFGWARIEVLSCLCTLLFIASLCFSIGMESIQTAAHAGHQDPMHHPLYVIALGGSGIILNAVVLFLIGGYTHHQGCFLERRSSGVWVQKRVTEDAVQAGMRTLLHYPAKDANNASKNKSYEGVRGIVRDVSGLIVVILCAAIVHYDTGGTLALYIDPGFAMISVSLFLYLSFPYGKECCQILLQTIPGNIDVQRFSAKLLEEFPEVVNIHHLHIWSLTPGKVIATAHVVYSNPKVFHNSINALKQFFIDKDITQVTLQPEFVHYSSGHSSKLGSSECLIKCTNTLCRQKECCDGCSQEDNEEDNKSTSEIKLPLPFRASICNSPASLSVSISSDHHGTSAFRNSDIDLELSKNVLKKRSRSKEDLSKSEIKDEEKTRRNSFHFSAQDDCFYITENELRENFKSSIR